MHLDTSAIKSLKRESIGAQVTITLGDDSSVTEDFFVHVRKHHVDLDFAKNLEIGSLPYDGEVKAIPPIVESTEPGCSAASVISFIAKVAVGAFSFGAFAATRIMRQLQRD